MISINEIRRQNTLKIITDRFEGSQSKLARALGYENPSFISRLVSDRPGTQKNIGDAIARKIEAAAGHPEYWLDQLHTNHVEEQVSSYNVMPMESVPTSRMVPIISWVQAGSWSDAADPLLPGTAEEWMPSPVRCSPLTFVLRVRGASMEPKFHDGELIVVDPEAEARNKSFVIVRLDDSKEATFKQLIIDGSNKYLQPLNPQWPEPIIKINGNATICGVVIFKGEKL